MTEGGAVSCTLIGVQRPSRGIRCRTPARGDGRQKPKPFEAPGRTGDMTASSILQIRRLASCFVLLS